MTDDEMGDLFGVLSADEEDAHDGQGKSINQQPAWDRMLHQELVMNKDPMSPSEKSRGIVKRRAISPEGKTTGTYHEEQDLNTMEYEVEFDDGMIREYAANVIAENMINQVESEQFTVQMFDSIVDHKKEESTKGQKPKTKENSFADWQLLVRWKNGSEEWKSLKEVQDSLPIEVAEYAKSRCLDSEEAFKGWVPFTLCKKDAIIAAVSQRKWKTTHKFGIEIPRTVEQAMAIDRKASSTHWQEAIKREMSNIGIAFEILEEKKATPVGWSKVTGHMIFDVKMDFTRKARWVLDGHKTPSVEGSTYAGVVSRESVRIALTYASLNGLQVFAADIQNAYLQAPSSQKDYIICGSEFGLENISKRALIHRALYGGKAAGRDFRNHLRNCMNHLQYKSCEADPDVWLRPAIKPNGEKVYEYILLYVDDALVVGINAKEQLDHVGTYFEFKKGSIGPPSTYLGSQLRLVVLENGQEAWGISSPKYVQAAVQNVEDRLKKTGQQLKKATAPMRTSYCPDLDVTRECDPEEASYYMSAIGVLRWIVELGRVDTCLEVSLLSSHLALPRVGHLEQVYHMFSYLKHHHNGELVLDPSPPDIKLEDFERKDWSASEFGHLSPEDTGEPENMIEPRGKGFIITAKVDADHASNTVTRRSRTGFLVWVNCALVYWMSKKQASVETSSFGSEFIAMKQCLEYIRGLRYKLKRMGIPCDGPAYVYGDNQSVLANATIPESVLKKKCHSVAYHFIREGCARDEWRMTYINTHENDSDLLTKVLPYGEKRRKFVKNLIHHVYE